jgi:arylsulfatase A-like enzyme
VKPNILIFMTDHQRADTVLPNGPAHMPNVAQLVAEGVRFSETHCPTPHCCPSRASFFSGLYPSRHGVWNNVCNDQALRTGLLPGVRLWSEDLQQAGYKLHYSGKWHVSADETPKDRGWTEHLVTSTGQANMGLSWQDYEDRAKTYDSSPRQEGELVRLGYPRTQLYGVNDAGNAHDEKVVDTALSVLTELEQETDPWCLYVGAIGPHDPYVAPQRFLDMYPIEDIELPVNFADAMTDKPRVYQRMREQVFGQFSDYEYKQCIRHFYAFCSYLDDLFGKLMNKLHAMGQDDNTLVIYCSDHGDYNGEHGLFAKGIPCFNGAYHVPNVMRWPQGIANPGRVVDDFVSLADFAPTFQELAGLEPDTTLTGSSLVPFLCDEQPTTWRDDIATQCDGVELYYTQRSIRTKDYKYTFNGFDQDELYDLRIDPHEMRNVADDPHYQDIKRDMCRRLWRFAKQENDSANHSYLTIRLAPYGPMMAFMDESG